MSNVEFGVYSFFFKSLRARTHEWIMFSALKFFELKYVSFRRILVVHSMNRKFVLQKMWTNWQTENVNLWHIAFSISFYLSFSPLSFCLYLEKKICYERNKKKYNDVFSVLFF